MKSTIILPTLMGTAAVFALTFPGADAQAQPGQCLGPKSATIAHVFVDGVRSSKGLIAITLYSNRKSDFLTDNGDIWGDRVAAEKGTVRACIHLTRAITP